MQKNLNYSKQPYIYHPNILNGNFFPHLQKKKKLKKKIWILNIYFPLALIEILHCYVLYQLAIAMKIHSQTQWLKTVIFYSHGSKEELRIQSPGLGSGARLGGARMRPSTPVSVSLGTVRRPASPPCVCPRDWQFASKCSFPSNSGAQESEENATPLAA